MIYLDVALTRLALGVLGLVLYGPWQACCVDAGRDEMFHARDAIVMLAAEGDLAFDDPGYRQIRDSLNKLIRFAHPITFHRVLLFSLLDTRGQMSEPDLSRALDNLRDDADREEGRMNIQLAANTAGRLLIMRSPVPWPLIPMIVLADHLARLNAKYAVVVARMFKMIQSDAKQFDKSRAREPRIIRAGIQAPACPLSHPTPTATPTSAPPARPARTWRSG